MIPILFKADETEFKTNGLGRLADAIECKVTEERNGSYELEMTYPIDGIHYSDIQNGCLILAEPSQDADNEPFEIYLITRPLNGQVKIKAEHISYRMKYIPVKTFTATTVKSALQCLKDNAVCSCPFTFETDKEASGTFTAEQVNSMRSFLADGDKTITAVYDGEWEFKRFRAILHKSRGVDNGVTIQYGKNLTSLEQEENIEEMYSGIYPYWTNTDNDTTTTVEIPEKILKTAIADKIPYDRILAVDFSSDLEQTEITRNWTEQTIDPSTSRIKTEEKSETIQVNPSPSALRQVAQAYIKDNALDTPKVSLKVEFTQLWQSADYENLKAVEQVHLCDTVSVKFDKLGVSATAKVIKTEYDVLNERYDSIDIGEAKATLNDVVQGAIRGSTTVVSGGTSAGIANRVEELEKEQSRTRTGSKSVSLTGTKEATLLTDSEIDNIFGLTSGTSNNTNIIVTAVNADETIHTPITGCYYGTSGWYVVFSDTINGIVKVNYKITRLS